MIRASTSERNESRHGTVVLPLAALGYGLATVSATMTLNRYLSQTWDVRTFIDAGHRFIDGGTPFDLYARSRAGSLWPYAYPPLHALGVAVAIVRLASWRDEVDVRCDAAARPATAGGSSTARRRLVLVSAGLFSSGVVAVLLQPLAPRGGGPREMPIVPAGSLPRAVAVLACLVALEAVVLALIRRITDARRAGDWIVPSTIVAAFTPCGSS